MCGEFSGVGRQKGAGQAQGQHTHTHTCRCDALTWALYAAQGAQQPPTPPAHPPRTAGWGGWCGCGRPRSPRSSRWRTPRCRPPGWRWLHAQADRWVGMGDEGCTGAVAGGRRRSRRAHQQCGGRSPPVRAMMGVLGNCCRRMPSFCRRQGGAGRGGAGRGASPGRPRRLRCLSVRAGSFASHPPPTPTPPAHTKHTQPPPQIKNKELTL